jgi:outer membrane protein OmpA-like peptidoglycan-associated protein
MRGANRGLAALSTALVVGANGCATIRQNRDTCRIVTNVVGATLGATGGGLGTWAWEGSDDTGNGEIAGGAAIGLVAGTILGVGAGLLLCPEAEAPPPPPPPPPVKLETFEAPYFDFDKATLRPLGYEKCDRIAAAVKTKSTRLRVTGYTDSIGSEAYNLRLGERRAESVERCLVERGVGADRITVRSLGEADPVASNATEDGRQKNRRVEVVEE